MERENIVDKRIEVIERPYSESKMAAIRGNEGFEMKEIRYSGCTLNISGDS